MTQLSLRLALPPRYGREDFLVSGSNEAAFRAVERWPHWPDPVLMVTGPPGAGKTHLCHVWAGRAGARTIVARDFVRDPTAIAASPCVIDGADDPSWPETDLFHLLNLVRQAPTSLLITARLPPDRWGVRTPDLLSRLRLAPLAGIDPPDEALVRAVLVKLFDDRQIRVDAAVIDYLTARLDRSLDAARTVVEALDIAGLNQGRPITRPMAADLLKSLALDED